MCPVTFLACQRSTYVENISAYCKVTRVYFVFIYFLLNGTFRLYVVTLWNN